MSMSCHLISHPRGSHEIKRRRSFLRSGSKLQRCLVEIEICSRLAPARCSSPAETGTGCWAQVYFARCSLVFYTSSPKCEQPPDTTDINDLDGDNELTSAGLLRSSRRPRRPLPRRPVPRPGE